jgi:hypothetical protein
LTKLGTWFIVAIRSKRSLSAEAVTGAPSAASTPRRKLVLGVASLALSGIVAGILNKLGVNDGISTTIVPGIPGLVLAFDEIRDVKMTSAAAQLVGRPLKQRELYRRPIPLTLSLSIVLVFLERLALGLVIATTAGLLWVANSSQIYDIAFLTGALASAFIAVLLGIASIFIGRYMTHRIENMTLFWVELTCIIAVAIDLAISLVVFALLNLPYDKVTIAAILGWLLALECGGAYLGYRWAKREGSTYLLGQFYNRLAVDDKSALVDLLVTPSR